eukprot:scaffold2153_cov131-Cylindrotheca_fusiformis.AAC.4
MEPLTEPYFNAAREIENMFTSTGNGFCFGLCPYRWCPMPQEGFSSMHRNDPERCLRYGIAIEDSNDHDKVVGIIKLRHTNTSWIQSLMYRVQEKEVYIELIVVLPEKRGKGIGTQMLQWAESEAKEIYQANQLALVVTKGNPAKRLYERFGFDTRPRSAFFLLVCAVGRPNGRFGADWMVKKLKTKA